MPIEHWGYFSVSHPLWHGASDYNGHLRGPLTLTLIAERLAVTTCFYVYGCRGWHSNTQPSACGANALTHCATADIKIEIFNNRDYSHLPYFKSQKISKSPSIPTFTIHKSCCILLYFNQTMLNCCCLHWFLKVMSIFKNDNQCLRFWILYGILI